MMVHTAYYLSEDEWWVLLTRGPVYSLDHIYTSAAGTFINGEGHWRADEKGVFSTIANGNRYPYVHKQVAWAYQPGFTVRGKWVVAEVLHRVQTEHLVRLTLTDSDSPPPSRLPFTLNAMCDLKLSGDFDLSGVSMPIDVITKVGPFLQIQGRESLSCFIPADLVNLAATEQAFKPRTPDQLQTLTHFVRRRVKDSSIPTSMAPSAVAAVVVLANVLNVRQETGMLQWMNNNFGEDFGTHRYVLGLIPYPATRVWVFVLITFLGSAFGLLLMYLLPVYHHVIGYVTLSVFAALPAFTLLGWCVKRSIDMSRENFLHDTIRSGGVPSLVEPLLLERGVAITPRHEFPVNPEIREGGSLEVRTVNKPREPRSERVLGNLDGIGFDITVPTMMANDLETQIAGLRHRVLSPIPPLGEVTFRAMVRELTFSPYSDVDITGYSRENAVHNWLRHLPPKNQMRLRVARSMFDSGERVRSRKAFVKTELGHGKNNRDGGLPAKPRIIQAAHDTHTAATGPYAWWLSQRVADALNPTKTIFYTRGATSEKVGHWFTDAVNFFGGEGLAFCCEWDFVGFDCHRRKEHRGVLDHFLQSADADELEALRDQPTYGSTRDGVHYRTGDSQINSGDNTTNVEGSLINATLKSSFDRHYGLHTLNAIAGDDGISVTSESASQIFLNHFEEWALDAGFEVTLRVSSRICDVEFCSKLFYPAFDGDGSTNGQLVYWKPGVKIGRGLSRLGYTTTAPNSRNLRARAIQSARDNNHVPFVRDLALRTMELSSGQRPNKAFENPWEMTAEHASNMVYVEAMRFVEERYGVDASLCAKLALDLKTVTRLPALMPGDPYTPIFERDFESDV
jgi:hypothetical protein